MHSTFALKNLCTNTYYCIINYVLLMVFTFRSKESVGGAWRPGRESRGIEKGDGGQTCKGEKEKER